LLSVYYVRCYLVYIYSMLWPCSSEIDDGLSMAGQYAGRDVHDNLPAVATQQMVAGCNVVSFPHK